MKNTSDGTTNNLSLESKNKMRSIAGMQSRLKSCRIGRRADNQGPRPLARNQAVVEKSATGTDFSQSLDSHQKRDQPNPELPRTTTQVTTKKMTRKKWPKEEYSAVYLYFAVNLINHQEEMLQKQLLISGKRIPNIREIILTVIS